jgi:hypothetical protein
MNPTLPRRLRGAAAATNFPLSPEALSRLDGMSLSQLLASFKTAASAPATTTGPCGNP